MQRAPIILAAAGALGLGFTAIASTPARGDNDSWWTGWHHQQRAHRAEVWRHRHARAWYHRHPYAYRYAPPPVYYPPPPRYAPPAYAYEPGLSFGVTIPLQ